MKAKDDPCVSVCRFDGTGRCNGCARTQAESRAWRKLSPFRRTALADEGARRLRRTAET